MSNMSSAGGKIMFQARDRETLEKLVKTINKTCSHWYYGFRLVDQDKFKNDLWSYGISSNKQDSKNPYVTEKNIDKALTNIKQNKDGSYSFTSEFEGNGKWTFATSLESFGSVLSENFKENRLFTRKCG